MSKILLAPSVMVAVFACACTTGPSSSTTSDAGTADGSSAPTDAATATDGSSSTDAGIDSGLPVTVTPANPTVLTCSKTVFDATWSPASAPVTSVSFAASAGAITPLAAPDGGTGDYATFTAPATTAGSPVTITAEALESVAGPPATQVVLGAGSTAVTVIQPTPQTGTHPAPSATGASSYYPNLWMHAMSSNGDTVYAALPTGDTTPTIDVWRSDDGGKTWNLRAGHPPAITAGTGAGNLQDVVIAADVGNPMTVYVAFSFPSGSTLPGLGGPATYAGLGFMVSTDGGDTFRYATLATAASFGANPDVISPSAGTVVVLNASNVNSANARIFETWTDATSGAALAAGALTATTAPGCVEPGDGGSQQGCCSLDESGAGGACQLTGYNLYTMPTEDGMYEVGASGGGPYSNPNLFTDGKGALCVAYTDDSPALTTAEPLVQCSGDLGATWAAQIHFTSPLLDTTGTISHPVGAMMPASGGQEVLSLTWTESVAPGNETISVATLTTNPASPTTVTASTVSTAGALKLPLAGAPSLAVGATSAVFYDGSGVLWLTYGVGGTAQPEPEVVVDRSCDQGATWLGGQYVGTVADMGADPGLVQLSGTMGVFANWGGSPGANDAGGGPVTVGDVLYRLSP